MKILAFAASNSVRSINTKLVIHAGTVIRERVIQDAQIEVIDLNDFEMTIYSVDRENQSGVPSRLSDFSTRSVKPMPYSFLSQSTTGFIPLRIRTFLIGRRALIPRFIKTNPW